MEDGPYQFKEKYNFIYESPGVYPNTIIVGNGTYRVYRNVDRYVIEKPEWVRSRIIDIISLGPDKPVKKFVCRTVDEMAQALAWVQPTKK